MSNLIELVLRVLAGETGVASQAKRLWVSLLGACLFSALLAPFSYGEQTACREIGLKPISPQYGEPEPGASGSVCFAEKSTDSWPITVKLSGLIPNESYRLSINCKEGEERDRECQILGTLKIPGWLDVGKYVGKEGYWDFQEITTDAQGNLPEQTITLPLQPGKYLIKFFVKKNKPGGPIVLHNDSLVFEVTGGNFGWAVVIASVLVLLAGLLFDFREKIVKRWKAFWKRFTPPVPPPPPPPKKSSGFVHSEDFRSVQLDGQPFTLTPLQAQVIEILFEAHKNGTPELGQAHILEKMDSKSQRLRDVFKSSSEAWGKLIVQGKKRGTVRLNL